MDVSTKMDRIDTLKTSLNRLDEATRQDAWEQARQLVAGKEIDEADYPVPPEPEPLPAEYPNYMVAMVVVLCIVVLVAAFIPSAFRLYQAGATVFCDAFQEYTDSPTPWWVCMTVGVNTVIMAEIGQTVALLAIAVLGTSSLKLVVEGELTAAQKMQQKATTVSNRIFWSTAAMSTAIAYIGNFHVAKPWLHTEEFFGLFAWLLDAVPPTMVILVMYALKELMLYFIRRRFQYLSEIAINNQNRIDRIDNDRRIRAEALQDPESQPLWLKYYSISLKDAILAANMPQKGERKSKAREERVDLVKSLSREEWKWLIKMEMIANDFEVDPTAMTVVERIQQKVEEKVREEAGAESVEVTADDLATVADSVWQKDDGTWSFKSELSGYQRDGLKSRQAAETALKRYDYGYARRKGIK